MKAKRFFPIATIILVSIIFRFAYLDCIPTAISGDELHYALTAKSIWLTGHDISGTWKPLTAFFFRYPPGEQQAELPYFLHLPFSGPFPFSLFLAKLPFALLSVGIVVLLYGIAYKIFGKTVGVATGLIAAVNPWLVVMGRTGYESTPATFFYLLALWVLLSTQSWKVLLSLIPFMLAFYSYIGTKIILIPFVALSFLLAYHKRSNVKPYILLIIACLVITAGYLILLNTSPVESRVSEILLPSSPAVATQVNEIRRTSVQTPLLPFLVNKYAAYIQIVSSKIFRIFSPTYLFLEGDQFFLPAKQSFFYYIDFLFLLWGALYIFSKKIKYFLILTGFIIIGTFPHLFHTTMGDFSAHLALMFPFMIMFIGAGIADCIDRFQGRLRPVILGLVAAFYALNVASFSMIYFFQYPLTGSGDFPIRTLSRYASLAKQSQVPITIYSTRSGDLLTKFLFYTNALTRESIEEISHIEKGSPFIFHQIHFTDCNSSVNSGNAPQGTLIYDQICAMHVGGPELKISSLLDGGQKYAIVNDSPCSRYSLSAYPFGIRISDFSLERLSQEDFCKIFISR